MLGFSDMQNHKDYHKHIYKITNIVKNLRKILEIEYLEETDHWGEVAISSEDQWRNILASRNIGPRGRNSSTNRMFN